MSALHLFGRGRQCKQFPQSTRMPADVRRTATTDGVQWFVRQKIFLSFHIHLKIVIFIGMFHNYFISLFL